MPVPPLKKASSSIKEFAYHSFYRKQTQSIRTIVIIIYLFFPMNYPGIPLQNLNKNKKTADVA
jgi:hypothetical protein